MSAFALGACNPAGQGQASPTPAPTQAPVLEAPTSSIISTTGACLDPATAGILSQLQAQGANVPTILANNKDALIKGLQGFQPQDAATATWRDQLVAALQAGDMTKAATEVQMLASAQVAVASC
ncbi:MAG TPA: hypothetical protein VET90_00875 [Candidatus Binatus sp.]|nr:hypothetical protein [Candidatus Binatus sp.]